MTRISKDAAIRRHNGLSWTLKGLHEPSVVIEEKTRNGRVSVSFYRCREDERDLTLPVG